MVTPELLDFIRAGHTSGMSKEAIELILINEGGWSKEDVAEAFTTTTPAPQSDDLVVPSTSPHTSENSETTKAVAPLIIEKMNEELPAPEVGIISSQLTLAKKATHTLPLDKKEEKIFAPEGDDFLGIFSGLPSQENSEILHIQKPAHDALAELQQPSPPPPPIAKEERKEPPTAPLPLKTAPLKFNFEKLRTGTTTETPPAAVVPMPAIQKQGLAELLAPSPSVYPHLSPEEVARAAPPQKRTMASDMLLFQSKGEGLPKKEEPETTEVIVAPPIPKETIPTPSVSTPTTIPITEEGGTADGDLVLPITTPPTAPLPVKSTTSESASLKNRAKRLLVPVTLGIIGISLLLVVGYVAFRFVRPGVGELVGAAQKSFFTLSALGYTATASSALHLTSLVPNESKESDVNIRLSSSGGLLMDNAGYGNGVHSVKINGGIQSGPTAWPTDVEMDVRVIGSSLYFHLLALPPSSKLDPELFRSYWMRVDLAEIAKELALSGVVAGVDGYGGFGGQDEKNTFNALFIANTPLENFAQVGSEEIDGVNTEHVAFDINSDKALVFVSQLYRKYVGTELILSDDERVRLLGALEKINGELWISKNNGMLVRIALHADLDDDVVRVHVKGPIHLDINLRDFNIQPSISVPTPVLTLEELRVQMESYKATSEMRVRDREKVDTLKRITPALEAHKAALGRYPSLLSELYDSGSLSTSTISDTILSTYEYSAYQSESPLSAATLCGTKWKTCNFYHIGVTLEEAGNGEFFSEDADVKSAIRGGDEAGCSGEPGRGCYDLVSTKQPSTPTENIQKESTISTTSFQGHSLPNKIGKYTLEINGMNPDGTCSPKGDRPEITTCLDRFEYYSHSKDLWERFQSGYESMTRDEFSKFINENQSKFVSKGNYELFDTGPTIGYLFFFKEKEKFSFVFLRKTNYIPDSAGMDKHPTLTVADAELANTLSGILISASYKTLK